ncbi:MAG: LysR family transcriptional regulator [Rhizobiales bacterium]|nr:LysR family transcriptional regulator [Hyphomicrobiales bacterium]MBI3673913.1 LysR family transcriptional regulator [Hyphomicrobiales bacterium]
MGPIDAMNFAAFDLNLLRVFDALMRERSVTRAGEQVGLSQPAVSAALHRLRDLLGNRLFVRQANDMVPTPRAESLAPGVREALARLEALLADEAGFDPAAETRTFTLMGGDFFSTLLMPGLAERVARLAPRIALRFLDSARGDVERLLRDDAIDVALERPLDMLEWIAAERLFLSPFKLIVAASNPAVAGLDPEKPMPLDLFCALPWAIRSIDGSMTGLVDEALAKLDRQRRIAVAVPHFHALPALVAEGRLAAAVPAQFAASLGNDGRFLVLDPPFAIPAPEIRLYWHSRHGKSPAHRWFRTLVAELAAPLAATS